METKLKYYSRIKQRRRIVAQAFFKIRGIIIRSIRMKPEANFIGSVNDRGTDAFRNSSMEERKEERKKKLFVPRIRVGSFKLLNIDARRDQVLVREKGEKNFLNPFFFFPLLNRQNAFPHFPRSQRDYLSLPLPRFFLFLFFSSR